LTRSLSACGHGAIEKPHGAVPETKKENVMANASEIMPPSKQIDLKTYTVLLAEDVPHYGSTDIEAEDDAGAIKIAKALDISGICCEASWDAPVCRRIVRIEDSKSHIIATDLALDDYVLSRRIDPPLLAAAEYAISVNNDDGDCYDIAILRGDKPIATVIVPDAEIVPLIHAGNCFADLVLSLQRMLGCFSDDSVVTPGQLDSALRSAREIVQKATGGTHV
jgi:hypothetical protein